MAIPAVPPLSNPCVFPTFACIFSILRHKDVVKNYEGYQVLRFNITTPKALETITNLFLLEEYDFWNTPSRVTPTDIMVPPYLAATLKSILDLLGLPFEVIFENLEKAIEFEKRNYVRKGTRGMGWFSYQSVETIHAWMDSMAVKHPNLVSIENFGNSSEGRPMKLMKISTAGPGSNRSAVWLDGGAHAGEWISPATVTYMANELIKQATRKGIKRYVDAIDYYIVPLMNPDGYEFAMSKDRMWRKTRSKPKQEGATTLYGWCKGVDPSRNWNYQWGGKGSSKKPCASTFRGDRPASEPEVSAAQDYIMSIKDQLKLFLTFHSYSQLLLLPWAYNNIRPEDHTDLMEVGMKAISALESVSGTQYKIGPTAELLYPASGGSFDWAKAVAGVKFSYAFELRDTGKFGLLLPSSNIVPSGIECLAAVKSMVEDIMKIYRI